MRRTERLVLVAVVAVAALAPLATARASAVVDRQAWTRTGPLGPPDPHDGTIYVSAAGGQEQARAFLHVDVSGIDAADLAGASVTLGPAPDGVATDRATLVVCALAGDLTGSGEIDDAPAADCSRRAAVERGSDGTWRVPIEVFADGWAAGANRGLAVLPDPEATPSVFTVAFETARTALDVPPASRPPVTSTTATTLPTAAPTTVFAVSPPEVPAAPSAPTEAAAPTATRTSTAPVVTGAAAAAARAAAHPSAIVILVPVLLAAAALLARSRHAVRDGAATIALAPARLARWAAWVAVPLALMTLGETTVYKLGLVAIAFIAATGLHLLVNWTGELSLAHAGFIGVPAFAVAQLSANTGLSPLVGLPLAVAVGVALGAVVGVAALRSRGLQVALVTLAVGIAVGQFLFFRSWLVGPPGGLQVPVPSLLGLEVRTSRALVPVLALAVLLAVLVATSIMRSTVGRALLLVRSNPDVAAAAGIAVARHRALAYAIAGGFAGLAGWSYVVWVQQVSAKAFPLQLGFTYLVIAALAGSGGLAGVVAAAALIQGGALFSFLPHTVALYLAPVALIVNVTRYQQGFNGVLRTLRGARLFRIGATMSTTTNTVRPLVLAGTLAVVAGFAAIALAWYHAGNTDAVWVQNQELLSGGVGGLGLIVLGATLLLRDALLVGRAPTETPGERVAAVVASNGRARLPVTAR